MDFQTWCRTYFPTKGSFSQGGMSYACCNPFRKDGKPSLSLTIFGDRRGKWKDHGTGEGGDLRFFLRDHDLPFPDELRPWEENFSPPGESRRELKPAPQKPEPPREKESPTTKEALELWESAGPADPEHPYLVKKKLPPEELRQSGDVLLIPAFDIYGVVVGLERIFPDGSKKHLGEKSGAFHPVNPLNPDQDFFLSEGYATATAAARLIPGNHIECFGTNGLVKALQALKEAYPKAKFYVLPDHDQPGEKAAQDCEALGAQIIRIPAGEPEKADWWDLWNTYGETRARQMFREAMPSKFQTKTGIRILRWDELMKIPPVRWVIKNLIPRGRTNIFADTAQGKSYVAIDMAMHVATSQKRYYEWRIPHPGPVLYVAGEGLDTIYTRSLAWLIEHDMGGETPLFFPTDRGARLPDRESIEDLKTLCDQIREECGAWPSLIVLDTVSANRAPGTSENSNDDMQAFAEAMKEISDHADMAGMVAVHHSGKINKEASRGGSSLKAAMNVEFLVDKNDSQLTLTQTKNRHGTLHIPINFEFRKHDLGFFDEDGRMAEESVLFFTGTGGDRSSPHLLIGNAKIAFDTFKTAVVEHGIIGDDGIFQGVHADEWRPFFFEKCGSKDKSAAYYKGKGALVDKGLLSISNDVYRYTDEIQNGVAAMLRKARLKEPEIHPEREDFSPDSINKETA